MPPITVDQGLNQSDPVTLRPGELSRADNSYYKPADLTLYRVKGRTAFNGSAEANAIRSVRALQFDGTAGYFVGLVGSTYRKATIGTTGSFSAFVSGISEAATYIDATHYNNEQVIVNGIDRNYVARADGTAILHGMLAAVSPPTLTLTGVLTGFTLSSGATITYWVEERVKEGSVIVKRHASTAAQTVTLTGTGALVKPVVSRPPIVNPDTTHWALFATETNLAFPVGGEIAEVAAAVVSIEDTRIGTDPAIPAGGNYQVYTTTDQFGVQQTVARNGPPPIGISGDIMNDSLVLWSATEPSILQYSIPDKIHQFPSSNLIRIESKEQDIGVAFRYVGSVGVALMRDSAWAINTLPKPDDAQFAADRVKKQIDGAAGCVGPLAASVFSYGDGALLAYVSPGGIVFTDTRSWGVVTDDLDWGNLVEPSLMHKIVLTTNPDEYRLEMRYTPLGGTRNTKAIYIHYHLSHLKVADNGQVRAKVTGPIDLPANDAAIAVINRRHRVFSANEDGKLYLEDEGFVSESGETLTMLAQTRDEYLAGIGAEAHIKSLLVHHIATAGAEGIVRMIQHVHGQPDTPDTTTIPLDRREATPTFDQAMADAFQFEFEQSTANAEVGLTLFVPVFETSELEGK